VLPFTGASTTALLAVGLVLLGLGGAALMARAQRG
jgi:LPXTG-motif cell wall-anchored protein